MIDQKKILEILNHSGVEKIPSEDDFGKPFKEIGIDSLDVFNFLGEIEVELGKTISDSEFENINTLNDVLSFLNR